MNNYEFLIKYIKMQISIGLMDQSFNVGNAIVAYSKEDPSTYGTFALVNKPLTQEEIALIENVLISMNKISTIFFEHNDIAEEIIESLGDSYKKDYEDSWLFWPGGNIDHKYFEFVKKVEDEEGLKIFLDIFDRSFQKDDPQNPYGDQKEFLPIAKRSWEENHTSGRLEYFIVYKDAQPVSISALTNFNGFGYISNVGSLREVRGRGFGKAATLYSLKKSVENGNTEHAIATEEGHFPNEFYKRIGFKVGFTSLAYTNKALVSQ